MGRGCVYIGITKVDLWVLFKVLTVQLGDVYVTPRVASEPRLESTGCIVSSLHFSPPLESRWARLLAASRLPCCSGYREDVGTHSVPVKDILSIKEARACDDSSPNTDDKHFL